MATIGDLLLLSPTQMRRIEPFFPRSHGVPRVDDRRVLSGILFWLAERSLRSDLQADIGRALESEARLVREALPPDSTSWPRVVRRLSGQIHHRITLIDRDGWVRADSDFPPGPLPPIQNHADRPEVRAALAGKSGAASRRSETVGRLLLYVAIPGGPGVVRRPGSGR